MVLLSLTVPDGTRILSLTGAAYLPMCGVNSHGIAFYGNTLYARDERPGVPNAFKHRWLLEAATRAEADARARMRGRARGSNHLNAQAGGAIWDVEVSAERAVTIEADGWLVHTNHFTAPEMQDVERSVSAGSRLRLQRGRGSSPRDWPAAATRSTSSPESCGTTQTRRRRSALTRCRTIPTTARPRAA